MGLGIPPSNFGDHIGRLRVTFNAGNGIVNGFIVNQVGDDEYRVASDVEPDAHHIIQLAFTEAEAENLTIGKGTIYVNPPNGSVEYVRKLLTNICYTVQGSTFIWSTETAVSDGYGEITSLKHSEVKSVEASTTSVIPLALDDLPDGNDVVVSIAANSAVSLRYLSSTILPGQTATLTPQQATSLQMDASGAMSGQTGDASIVWRTGPNNTGGDHRVIVRITVVGETIPVPPTITSASTVSVVESNPLAHTLTANQDVTWSITGGTDQSSFEISSNILRFADDSVKDYSNPTDVDSNNTYIVSVTATSMNGSTSQTVTVAVLELDFDQFRMTLPSTGTQFIPSSLFNDIPAENTITINVDPSAPGTIRYLE